MEAFLIYYKGWGKRNESLSSLKVTCKLGASAQRSCAEDPPKSLHSPRAGRLTCSEKHNHGGETLLSSYPPHLYEFGTHLSKDIFERMRTELGQFRSEETH